MALTLTEQFRATVGGKKMMGFLITLSDGTPKSITAGSMDLTHIEHIIGYRVKMSLHANVSLIIEAMGPSIQADNGGIAWTSAGTNMVAEITVVGW